MQYTKWISQYKIRNQNMSFTRKHYTYKTILNKTSAFKNKYLIFTQFTQLFIYNYRRNRDPNFCLRIPIAYHAQFDIKMYTRCNF